MTTKSNGKIVKNQRPKAQREGLRPRDFTNALALLGINSKIIDRELAEANSTARSARLRTCFEQSPELRGASSDDLCNAVALLEYLDRCHRAALEVPGVGSALKSTPKFGIHCYDRAYCFVSNYLFEVQSWCKQRLEEMEKPGAICAS